MSTLYKYNEQNIFDYLLTNKGKIDDLISFLVEQNTDYDNFDVLSTKLYDNYISNDITNYYFRNKNSKVVSKNVNFNDPTSFTTDDIPIKSDNIPNTNIITDNSTTLYKYNDQNTFDYLLTNKGKIDDLISFLVEQNTNYDSFDTFTNKIKDSKSNNVFTSYYIKNNIIISSKNSDFTTDNELRGFTIGFSIGFNS